MTPQEQEMIGDLIGRVQKTELAEKDMDAEQMLKQGMGQNPDALYILAQTVLVQKYALEQAQTQLAQAKALIEQMQQHPEPKHASSFLGNLLGRNEAPAPPPPPLAPGWTTVPAYQQSAPSVGSPQYAPPPGIGGGVGGGGGFLQGALQTAAGVAAGALAFEGVESLMHGFGHQAGYGQGFGGFGDRSTGDRPEIINNYYGDERGANEHGVSGEHGVSNDERVMGDQFDRDFGSGRNDRGGSLDDKGTSDVADTSSFDDSGSGLNDNSSSDDGGSNFDDGGGSFDDGGGDSGGGGDDGSFS
jgi:uncharacterized protein